MDHLTPKQIKEDEAEEAHRKNIEEAMKANAEQAKRRLFAALGVEER